MECKCFEQAPFFVKMRRLFPLSGNEFKPCLIKGNGYEAGQSFFDVFFDFLALSMFTSMR